MNSFNPTHYQNAKSWPFEEAQKLLKRFENAPPAKGFVLLETGYGPSGLPHIGTFGEVARTTMVRHAFEQLSDIPTRLFCFSDDMDGLRKVPDNVPNQQMLGQHLGKPLTMVPDPYGQYESFGHHNNAMLRRFLDSFGFAYEFQSSSDWYKGGGFDPTLRLVLQHYDAIMAIMLPSLRDERRATYSPFLPICSRTGQVLQVPMVEIHPESDTVVYRDPETNQLVEVLITGGHCKLQWKVDWGMRWRAFEVDYEMSGKDLIDSVKLSTQICRALGGAPPETLTYELFLDQEGQKISKSKGNGLTIDEWLTYAPTESLSYYMFQAPRKAKRLYFDVIPRAVDDYLAMVAKYPEQTLEVQIDNPTYHVHKGNPPASESGLSFNILLNLASVCNAESPQVLWGFVQRYLPDSSPETMPFLARLIDHAIRYYQDFVKPTKAYRTATAHEKAALQDLAAELSKQANASAEDLQALAFEVGKRHDFTDLRAWFGTLYEVLLGQKEGPRMGSFIALYGVENTVQLIQEKLG
ncbi:lysine--tRNA ligase [Candidatus Finniella inopinata]|uniref:Lysine--tRNA ligase n=1 Tax=Candidatus Finniella inopinata TaxID=1696036 RepID=A0A4Q7DKH6_9PROT|nr:lysine--tRNA ligase [Candidatus Finniella inopinata]RZI45176.1 lysine--tRNA ligase [Candidatus Finniella inopinata]